MRVQKSLDQPGQPAYHTPMKTTPQYPIASPWLIYDEGDREIADLVELCDGQHPIGWIEKRTGIGQRRIINLLSLGERLGVIALTARDLPFLNAFYADAGGALLFEGAKIRGTSPSAWLAAIKTHYKELSDYLKKPPEEIHQLFQRSFGQEAPGNVTPKGGMPRPDLIIKAIWRRYESDAYLVRRHLIHFYGLTAGLLFSRTIKQIRERYRASVRIRVLDAGCGDGELMRRVRNALGDNCRAAGIDIGWNILKFARGVDKKRGIAPGDFLRSDAESLPFRRGVFDAICCFEVMEHLLSPGPALREFHRVLKPDGMFILSWSSGANLMSGHVSAAAPQEVRQALKNARFSVQYLEEIQEAQTTYVETRRSSPRGKP